MLIMLVLLLAGGGGGAYWWLSRAPVEAAAPREIPLSERGLVPFDPFMVNLADGSGNRFLKVNLQLVLETPEAASTVLKSEVVVSHMRSEILELLTQQTGSALVTTEGKAALKVAIGDRLAGVLQGGKVVDVLFSEFVVQF
jgi:flagellar FliL protein